MIKYILPIILLFVGCTEPLPLGLSTDSVYQFELDIDLEQDENGYYRLPMIQEGQYSDQMFHTLQVQTNNEYNPQMVYWLCDTFYEFEHLGFTQHAEIINENSYTYDDGSAKTIFGPHMSQVGDTVQILTGYKDFITDEIYTINFSIILDEEE
jgi:hypothetical protein